MWLYTPLTIKKCHFVFDYNSALLSRFLHSLHLWKQEGILYKQVNKIYHFTLTETTYKQHILKSITTVRSIELVVHNFRRKSSSVCISILLVGSSFISLLAEKLSQSHFFQIKIIRFIFKLNVFNFEN